MTRSPRSRFQLIYPWCEPSPVVSDSDLLLCVFLISSWCMLWEGKRARGWWEELPTDSSYKDTSAIRSEFYPYRGFPSGSDGKASACNAGDPGLIPELERSPEEENGNSHSSVLAWRILWAEEPCGLWVAGSQRGIHNWVTNTSSLKISFNLNYLLRGSILGHNGGWGFNIHILGDIDI